MCYAEMVQLLRRGFQCRFWSSPAFPASKENFSKRGLNPASSVKPAPRGCATSHQSNGRTFFTKTSAKEAIKESEARVFPAAVLRPYHGSTRYKARKGVPLWHVRASCFMAQTPGAKQHANEKRFESIQYFIFMGEIN